MGGKVRNVRSARQLVQYIKQTLRKHRIIIDVKMPNNTTYLIIVKRLWLIQETFNLELKLIKTAPFKDMDTLQADFDKH